MDLDELEILRPQILALFRTRSAVGLDTVRASVRTRQKVMPMPYCLVVQHVEAEPPGAIGSALESAGTALDIRRTFAGDPLPNSLERFAGLVVMGGPMSARNDQGFATRRQEIDLLAEAVVRSLPTIGVCLGAQLLAEATGGGAVTGEAGLEIGWSPVEFTGAADDDVLLSGLPPVLSVLHWHGDTFDIPPNGVLLASNGRYRNQAFRVGPRAWGLQFHIEVDRTGVSTLLEVFGDDVLAAGSTPADVWAATGPAFDILRPHRSAVLARFAALVAASDLQMAEPA